MYVRPVILLTTWAENAEFCNKKQALSYVQTRFLNDQSINFRKGHYLRVVHVMAYIVYYTCAVFCLGHNVHCTQRPTVRVHYEKIKIWTGTLNEALTRGIQARGCTVCKNFTTWEVNPMIFHEYWQFKSLLFSVHLHQYKYHAQWFLMDFAVVYDCLNALYP